jgi:hypothetical protein
VGGALSLGPGVNISGSVILRGAKVDGLLNMSGIVIDAGGSERALSLDHGRFHLGVTAPDVRVKGEISLHHAQVNGQLVFKRARVSECPAGAIRADHLTVDGSLFLDGSTVDGTVDLHGTNVTCHVELAQLEVTKPSRDTGWGLVLDRSRISGEVNMGRSSIAGGVNLTAANLDGGLIVDSAKITAEKGSSAFTFNRCIVKGQVSAVKAILVGRVSAIDASAMGGINFTDSTVGDDAPTRAIAFSGIAVKGDVLFLRAVARGAVDLDRCHVTGDVRFTDARLEGSPKQEVSLGGSAQRATGRRWRGTSLVMVSARVEGDLDCSAMRFDETIRLSGVRVERATDLEGAIPPKKDVPVLPADELEAGSLVLKFGQRPLGAIDLSHA